ncbi:hypothetical protein, partial [Staphylococcus sp. GDX8P80P]|uniref:hypothetical protein n=1 Tax=Staphylococcus sp. GDX8P80P TaxID=2804104 RepID=UPI001AEC35BA
FYSSFPVFQLLEWEWDRILFKFVVHSQLALLVEFLDEILFAGAPTPTCLACKITFVIFCVGAPLTSARMTRTEKSLI